MSIFTIGAVDPGTTNIAAWIGTYDTSDETVKTLYMLHGSKEEGSALQGGPKKKTKVPVYELTANCVLRVADKCAECSTSQMIVETAPQWNTPARISAAAAYGVLRGRGIAAKFSGPSSKAGAIKHFAEILGASAQLEQIPEEWDRMDKKTSSKVRLINKRNAVKVVRALMEKSGDSRGLEELAKSPEKQDDMADSLLLACSAALCLNKKKTKAKTCKKLEK